MAGPVAVSEDGRAAGRVTGAPGLATIVVRTLDQAGIAVDDVAVHQPSLDDVFFSLTSPDQEVAAR